MSNQKICTFFVSVSHLLTIILPYINELINEKKECIIISETDLTYNVKKYLNQIGTLPFEKEPILDLNWKKFKSKIDELDLSKTEIFVIGKMEFIKKINSKLEIKNVEKIINCYYINTLEEIENVPQNYEFILSTTGINALNKISQNEQKRGTIKSQI